MSNIKIISDSTCDLTPEQVKMHNICIVPLYVIFDGESFGDGTEIDTEKLYETVEKKKLCQKLLHHRLRIFIIYLRVKLKKAIKLFILVFLQNYHQLYRMPG